jgi:cation transport ATPase
VSQVLPEDKSNLIKELQAAGKKVCFVGDGINDSIALQTADVSVSMKGATDIATTVAQVVLMSGDLEQVVELFDLADQFEHYMRINRLATNLPAFLIVGGTLGFGWSWMTAVLLNQMSTPVALYSLLHPAATHASQEREPLEVPPADEADEGPATSASAAAAAKA